MVPHFLSVKSRGFGEPETYSKHIEFKQIVRRPVPASSQ